MAGPPHAARGAKLASNTNTDRTAQLLARLRSILGSINASRIVMKEIQEQTVRQTEDGIVIELVTNYNPVFAHSTFPSAATTSRRLHRSLGSSVETRAEAGKLAGESFATQRGRIAT